MGQGLGVRGRGALGVHSLGVGGREALGGHGVGRKEAGLPQHLSVSFQALTTG